MSRTRLAPTPTNIWMNSDPEIEKKGTPASPATARAGAAGSCRDTRRPISKNALGDSPAEPLELLGVLEELDDLLQLALGVLGGPATSSNVVRILRLVVSLAGLLTKLPRIPVELVAARLIMK